MVHKQYSCGEGEGICVIGEGDKNKKSIFRSFKSFLKLKYQESKILFPMDILFSYSFPEFKSRVSRLCFFL